MLRKLLFLLSFTVFFVPSLMAQQTGTISGTVTNAKTGKTVPAANVYIKKIQRGAATDKNGHYSIGDIPVGTYTLRVSYVGYQTFKKQIQVHAGKNTLDVQLKSGAVGLGQLVVTGTGTTSERNLTTSISHVSSQDIKNVPVQNTSGLLQGRAAGVQVTSTSGNPGSGLQVRIRGQGSINASSRPLYIVDGVQVSFSGQGGVSSSPLNGISPSDIKSISVLKGPAATAIYGSQGANGVVLITTKEGQSGATQVSATVTHGARSRINSVQYMGRNEYIKYQKEALQNKYGMSSSQADQTFRNIFLPALGFPKDTPYNQLPNTNWQNVVNRTGITQNYKMSVSGGSDNTQYYVSGGYENEEYHIPGSDYQNYHLAGNFHEQVSSKFSTKLHLNLSTQKQLGTCQDGFYINCPTSQPGFFTPLSTPYDSTGQPNGNFLLLSKSFNPVVTFKHTTRIQRTVHLIGSLSGTYHFEPWLSLHTQFGMDWRYVHYTRISDPIVAPAEGGFNRQDYHTTPNFDTKTTLNFSKSFNDANNVSALVGIEYRRDYTRFARVESQGFLSGRLVSVLSGGSKPTTAVGYNQEYRRGGYFANVKYNYKQRYYVNVTGRYDGSSRFGSNNRFGFFPAASAAWDISSENFFNANWVNDLKLRVSYGSSGNSELGRYRALSLFGLSGSYDGQTGLAPTQLANKNLTWEKATTLDLGIDYSMFSGRLHGSVDGYRRINSSLLLNAPLPAISGFNSIGKNIGKTRNEGVEFSLHSVNVQTGGFRWNTNFNITVQRNTVKKLIGNQKELNPGSITPVAVGHSINALKIWKWAGVDPADGRPLWYDKNGHLTHLPTNSDRQFVGSGDQSVIGGFGNSFKYKGLQLSVFFQYSYGQMAAPVDVWAFGMAQVGSTHSNGVKGLLKKAWHHQGQFAQFPYPQWGPSQYPGTQYYSDGRNGAQFYSTAYVRLKNATLSYNLPQTVVSAMHMRSVQFFVTGLNLLTFTHYPGFDPEVAGSTNGFNNSTNQRASFPAARVINGGITVKF